MSNPAVGAPMPRKTNRTAYELEWEQSERDTWDHYWFVCNGKRRFRLRAAEAGEALGKAVVCLHQDRNSRVISLRILSVDMNPELEELWAQMLATDADPGERTSKWWYYRALVKKRGCTVGFHRRFVACRPALAGERGQ